ncbi:MAG: hypothetical protein HDR80_07665 [Bacteroides sp.]|nr:hypothetical protein [Bacteroides sp.]
MKPRLSSRERAGLLYFAATVLLCLMLGPLARQWGCTRGTAPVAVECAPGLADSLAADSLAADSLAADSLRVPSGAPSSRRAGKSRSRRRTSGVAPERRSFRDEPVGPGD